MAKNNIALAARAFSEKWATHGDEKGEAQKFWLELLQTVLGVPNPYDYISFEGRVHLPGSTSFMDGYIPATRVLIEHKSRKVNLDEKIRQSDGTMLTPFQQAQKYVVHLPVSQHPRWIVACNFNEFRIYDMENPLAEPEVIRLCDLEKEYYRLQFLVDDSKEMHKREVEVSMAAGAIIGEIYDALLKEYRNPEDPHSQRSLNILCVRLVFCLYAEDSGLFDSHTAFHDYLAQFKPGTGDMRRALIDLFDVLNTPEYRRDPYLRDDLRAFPYVNGGLFAEKDIEIPRFNERIATLLLKHASSDFDWSCISPTIFGGVFESTLNPETRRKGGMHYTSIENIHKVIDPLFLDDLKAELADIKAEPIEKKRIARAKEFQEKIAGLKFLDPACGSGNFLTETFLSLRRLENECLRIIYKGNMLIGDFVNPIKVSISQFYGIEINDFAVSVAMTALWIAEAQMLFETESIMRVDLDFLPLKSYTNVHEGNALRMDWNEVVPAGELCYCFGNPPWIGGMMMSPSQKEEMRVLFPDVKGVGELDYVGAWYRIAATYIKGTDIECAFVSSNSICQGEQVAILWEGLMKEGIVINFAYRTFRWDSEASLKAHVHCIIIGFSYKEKNNKRIFVGNEIVKATHINGYLMNANDIFLHNVSNPLCKVSCMNFGNMPRDGGGFILNEEEKAVIIKESPEAEKWIHPFLGAEEFLHNKMRWCLWLKDANPSEIKKCPKVLERVQRVRDMRLGSKAASTRKMAETPTLFAQITQPPGRPFILIPRVSSERRMYVPIGFCSEDVISSDAALVVPDADLYEFGILISSVHNTWMRTVAGRLESRYRYSKDIVYNNFPWPSPKDTQKAKIEETAQAILDARALYPESSLADLYDDLTMPPELRKAHRDNDAAVMEVYGFRKDMTEAEIVAELFKMYQKLIKKEFEKKVVDDLLLRFPQYKFIDTNRESPDFVIGNSNIKIGIEVTSYYPHRNKRGGIVNQLSKVDHKQQKHKYFSKTELGYERIVPSIDIADLYKASISMKELKLESYRNNVVCDEYWLLIMLDFYDNVAYGWQELSIKTSFDKVFLWEEPDDITEIKALK